MKKTKLALQEQGFGVLSAEVTIAIALENSDHISDGTGAGATFTVLLPAQESELLS